MTLHSLRQLRTVLNASLDQLEAFYEQKNLDLPSLDEPYTEGPAESALTDPQIVDSVNAIIGASYQLISTVRTPYLSMFDAVTACQMSACLRVAEEIHAPEILREAGSAGLHVDQIAAKCGLEPTKLARVLRLLATHHIFLEVKPNVFATNRIASAFDSGKAVDALLTGTIDKYSGTTGAAAVLSHGTDEVMKASGYLWETLSSPEKGHSFSAIHAPMQECFKMNEQFFSWIERPENAKRFARLGAAMRGTSLWNSPDAILQGFDWGSLKSDDVIVDVGGGTGMPAMIVARAFQNMKIVIQEREQVVKDGEAYWSETYPEALKSGRITFQAHEFFNENPQKNASVFLVRTVLHDWPDSDSMKILSHLRQAATPKTRLLIGDYMIPYACRDDSPASAIPGAKVKQAPAPLLANYGKASYLAYTLDLSMLTNFNGQERTLPHLVDLCSRAGWKAVGAHRQDDNPFGYLVCEPAQI
ncbi:O-methyltransferase [Heliocybe sulcata]|uniref:O-methyltransferase n=1 Tax=Heliocybe sulcata TaxID=5364 RepID=A0A5C3MQW4_9AGAM|nr:O-methyltransferase [Heliocybe sulcata]